MLLFYTVPNAVPYNHMYTDENKTNVQFIGNYQIYRSKQPYI